jgi:Na+/H+-dicarboxylate symporter
MFAGLVLGLALGVVIHDDFSGSASLIPRFITWVQATLGIEPVAKSGTFTHDWLGNIGTLILVRPLMLLAIPVILVSVTLGASSIGDPTRLGLIAGATMVFFLVSTALATVIGVVAPALLKPGAMSPADQQSLVARADADLRERDKDVARDLRMIRDAGRDNLPAVWKSFSNQLLPNNLVEEWSAGRTLGMVFFAILLGLALGLGGEKCQPAIKALESLNDALMRLAGWILAVAPVGLFLMMAWSIGRVGVDAFTGPIMKFMGVAFGSMIVQGAVVLPVILLMVGRANPVKLFWQSRPALFIAFGAGSSPATMPVSLKTCVERAECSFRASTFVVPLGAAIHKSATAMVATICAVFLCQMNGVDMAISDLILIAITAALAAIGAAGMQASGLITLMIVLKAVNITLQSSGKPELAAGTIGVIIAVDRLLDMGRATLNTWSDIVAAKMITRLAPDG